MKIQNKHIDELIPYAKNARTHSNEQISQIAASIKEFGFNDPVAVDGENGIIEGHGRVLAAREMGMEQVPVFELSHLSDTQKRAYILAHNKLTENAGWDQDLLAVEMSDLIGAGFGELTGFDIDDFGEEKPGLTDPDFIPEEPEEPFTQAGDIWMLGEHRLLCGDSTDKKQVERLMNGEKADMVFTDPPYGMHLDTDWSKIKGSEKSIGFQGNLLGNKYDKVIGDNDDFKPAIINSIFWGFDYCKEMFIWGADYFIDLLPNFGKDGCLLVWNKRSSDEQQKAIGNCFELFWSRKQHKKYVYNFEWFGFLSKDAPQEARNRVHPTMKPVGLIERIWLWNKSPQGIVVDLFLGSGSTLIAAEKTGRKLFGCELEPAYVDICIERWQNYTGLEATLESTGQTFSEIKHGRT